jgi:hypothetical protein
MKVVCALIKQTITNEETTDTFQLELFYLQAISVTCTHQTVDAIFFFLRPLPVYSRLPQQPAGLDVHCERHG